MNSARRIYYFQLLLHVISAMELCLRFNRLRTVDYVLLFCLLLISSSAFALIKNVCGSLVGYVFFASQLLIVVRDFPATANHQYLFFLSSVLLVLLNKDNDRDGIHFYRLQTALVLAAIFWSGVQKFWHAHYFNGAFFTYALVHSPRFESFFSVVLGDSFVSDIRQRVLSSGSYNSDSLLILVLSNLVWIIEIFIPILYLWAPARGFVRVFLLLFILCLEFGAREVSFGLYVVGGLMLAVSNQWQRRLLLLASALYVTILVFEFINPLAYFH